MKANVRRVAMGLAVLLAVACTAQAVVITEADYEANADLTVVTSPGSPTGTVTGDAQLTRGVLVVSGNADSGAQYGVTGSPSLGAQPYFNIVQGGADPSWGENTVVVVLRRHNWDNQPHTILAATDATGANGIVFKQRANDNVLYVDLLKDGVGLAPSYGWKDPGGWGMPVSTIIEPDTDYVVAASWRDRTVDNEIDFRIFVRKVSDVPRATPDHLKVGFLDATVTAVDAGHVPAGFENMYMYVGRNAAGSETWNGKIARVEILNQYTETEEQFDVLFDAYVETIAKDYNPLIRFDARFDNGLTVSREYAEPNMPPSYHDGTLRRVASVSGGRLIIPATTFSAAVYDRHNDNLWRGGAYYVNATDFVNWGSNTIAVIAKRNTTDTGRHPIASMGWYNNYMNRDGWFFYQDGGIIGLNIYSNWDYVYTIMHSTDPCSPLYQNPPLTGGVDYFLAASWHDNGDETIDVTIYQREVSDLVGTTVKYKVEMAKGYSLGVNPPEYDWHLPHTLYQQILALGGITVFDGVTWNGDMDRVTILGEFNETQADYEALYHYMVHGEPRDCADVWNEGYGIDGDLNRDCLVNLLDMAYAAGEWLADDCAIFYNCLDVDVDGSGAVGLGDATILAEDWLRCNVPGQAGCEAPW